jgi:hypothetical protein
MQCRDSGDSGRVERERSNGHLHGDAGGFAACGFMLIERGAFKHMAAAAPDNRLGAARGAIPSPGSNPWAPFDAQGWSMQAAPERAG